MVTGNAQYIFFKGGQRMVKKVLIIDGIASGSL